MDEKSEKITLDLNSFKALASETRIHILKKLGERRATASELATSLAISVQAASEHLEKMRVAGLVARVSREEAPPHKWVYYELTDKGRALLQPESTKKIWVLLGTSILVMAAGFSRVLFDVFSPKASFASTATPILQKFTSTPAPMQPMAAGASGLNEVANQTIENATASVQPSTQLMQAGMQPAQAGGIALNSFELLLIVLGALALGASIMLFARARRRKAI